MRRDLVSVYRVRSFIRLFDLPDNGTCSGPGRRTEYLAGRRRRCDPVAKASHQLRLCAEERSARRLHRLAGYDFESGSRHRTDRIARLAARTGTSMFDCLSQLIWGGPAARNLLNLFRAPSDQTNWSSSGTAAFLLRRRRNSDAIPKAYIATVLSCPFYVVTPSLGICVPF